MRTPFVACLLTASLLLSGCGEPSRAQQDLPPEGNPQKRVGNDLRGYKFKSRVALGENYRAHWAKAILARYDPNLDDHMPSAIERADVRTGCTLPRARQGSDTVVVHVPSGGYDMPVFRTTDKVLARNAEKIINHAKTARKDQPLYGAFGEGKMMIDPVPVRNLVVTKTDAPVHLVLISHYESVWNIHTRPDTAISGITIIGPDGSGYVNAPDGTPVAMLAGAAMQKCGIRPAREPRSHWRFVKNTRNPNDDLLAKNRARYFEFARWLGRFYPDNKSRTHITALRASHVLVGPAPKTMEDRVPYRPVSGATLHIASTERVVAMPVKAYRVQIRNESVALAQRLAGATISELKKTR